MSQASVAGVSVRLPGWVWAPRDRKTAWSCAVLIGCCVGLLIAGFWVDPSAPRPTHLSGDFCALWSWAKIAFSQPATKLYDPLWLHGAQVALGMAPQGCTSCHSTLPISPGSALLCRSACWQVAPAPAAKCLWRWLRCLPPRPQFALSVVKVGFCWRRCWSAGCGCCRAARCWPACCSGC